MSVPSLAEVSSALWEWGGDSRNDSKRAYAEGLVFTYSRHHDPAVKAAREAMEDADSAMDMQEKRLCGAFHIPAESATCIWEDARTKLRTALAELREVGR